MKPSLRPSHQGFTVLEMMTAVAIIAAMTGLATSGMLTLSNTEKANTVASSLARAGMDARMMALNQQCPVILQINGKSFTGTGAQSGAGVAYIYRKQNCGAYSPYAAAPMTNCFPQDNCAFSDGDLPINSIPVPRMSLTAAGTVMDGLSLMVVYGTDGSLAWRLSGGTGAENSTSFTLTAATPYGPSSGVLFPSGGNPSVQ